MIAEGYKDTKIGYIPEEWDCVHLSEITQKFLNGGTPSTKEDDYWNGDIPWITGTDVVDTILKPSRRFITHKGVKNSATNIIPKGSILVVTRTGVGKISMAGCDLAISQDLTGVILKNTIADGTFYLWYLKQKSAPKYISLAQGTTIGGILRKDVERTPVPLPPLPEQRKIADILTAVDDAIEKTDAIIKETHQLKKGLTQKLFTEGIGHTRFKETKIGRIPESWELTRFKDVVNFKNGVNFSKEEKGNGGILVVDVKNMYSDGIYVGTSNLYRVNKDFASSYTLKSGDLLFVRSSLKREGVGWSALFEDYKEPVVFCGFLIRARLKAKEISPQFLSYFLRTHRTRGEIVSLSGTVAITNINQESLGLLKVVIPPLPEQQEIASILSEVYTRIENEQATKSELEQLKKGLSQVLLTGKVRVKV